MTLLPFVQTLARGPGRARSLTGAEAEEAMAIMLAGDAAPEAVGAILMLLRMKGETADEVAGLVRGARASLPDWTGTRPALDWPSYAAGRSRGLPWFLLSARLLAGAGYPVLLHGWNALDGGEVRAALTPLGITTAGSASQASDLLATTGIAYLPLETLSPNLYALLRLRSTLGLRSCVNTVLRVLNPAQAPAAVQGVFHPPYREIQMEAGALLGQPSLTILKGGGGEFERHPGKDVELYGLRDGATWESLAPALIPDTRRLSDGPTDPAQMAALWDGHWTDPFAMGLVIGTTAVALDTLGVAAAMDRAQALWDSRHMASAA